MNILKRLRGTALAGCLLVCALAPAQTLAVFRAGDWLVEPNVIFALGQSGDIPIVGDWDNTGFRRIGVFRNGQWWLDMNGDGKWDSAHDQFFVFGQAGDIPVIGDWTNTGVQRIGVFRSGQWWLDLNGDHQWTSQPPDQVFSFGQAGDIPIVGDWTNTHVQRIGVFRNGQWWLDINGDHLWTAQPPDQVFIFGQAGDIPVVGDWDNTGVQRIGVFRSGQWWLDINGDHLWTANPPDALYYYGQAGDAPVVGIATTVITTSASDLNTCINSSGTNLLICEVVPGTVLVYSKLSIGRSNTIITGGGGPGDTILVRGHPSLTYIMKNSGSTNVTISNLTFDGNRYGFGVNGAGNSCLIGNSPYYDLDTSGGTVTVEWVDFINAPGTALVLGGAGSSVSVSNFGQGGYGIAPDTTLRLESGQESATRSTAVYVTDGTGAWYNAISYAGTAGITLSGTGQYAYGNYLFNNRYELSDWYVGPPIPTCPGGTSQHCLQQGGQLALTGDPHQTLAGGCPGYTCSSNASVTGNVIIGNTWPPLGGPPYPPQATGCPWGTGSAFNAGVEAYGFGHFFYNNEINTNTGSGMQFAGSNPTGNITITSANPYDSSDVTRSIESNSHGGIAFLGPITNSLFTYPAVGVTLDDVVVQNNAGYGVALDTVSNYGSYVGFINNACLSGPSQPDTSPISWTTLSNPTPAFDNIFRGVACPLSGYSTPAPSHIPGWSW